MRQARIKIDSAKGLAVYHCMTRVVNGERLIDDVAKEVLRKQLWQVANYCGLQIVTYTILSNHFHVLVRVPQQSVVDDAELMRRYKILYPKPTKYKAARLAVVQSQLAQNGPEAVAWRKQQLAIMGDLSPFMKLVKQRFTIWFNRSHHRYGTLWAERFKSVLVESKPRVLQTMAAYIDLNAVRAGLVDDPKDYRFCGYAEAVVGNEFARNGLSSVVEGSAWSTVQSSYRQLLFGTGSGGREQGRQISREAFDSVLAAGGKLPLATVLRSRIRYFNDGAVLGSRAFIQTQLALYQQKTGRRKRTAPREIPPVTDWGDLCTMRGLRRDGFG